MLRALKRFTIVIWTVGLAACEGGPVDPDVSGPWQSVAAGDQFTCALTTSGHAWCWGSGIFGQLGNGATASVGRPVEVSGDHVFRTLAVGSDHACGITVQGGTWCWGLNDFSELGSSTGFCNATFPFARCASTPRRVELAPVFDSIAVAGYASCGLTASGQAHCWGWSDHGQVGSGAVGAVLDLPTLVTGAPQFTSLSLDIYHACATTAASGLYCWGSNAHGQLATDSIATPRCGVGEGFLCSASPVASAAGLLATRVSAGSTHTCAVVDGDGVWCWGSNQYGALGNPGTTGGRTPVRVTGSDAFVRVDAGFDHSCAIDADGAAWCWGLNSFGQLGVVTVSEACAAFGSAAPCRNSPGLVASSAAFTSISTGSGHACGLSDDGEIWCWGRGAAGQLGDDRSLSSNTPVRVAHP